MGGLTHEGWWEMKQRPTRLLSRGALAEKVNVLPEAAVGLPCPTGKDVSL